MNAFEHIAARYFEDQGFWTRIGVKIEISKADKRSLGLPSLPRPEVDVVAYKPATNTLLLVECKSYLDSMGVCRDNFIGNKAVLKDRFKLLNRDDLRALVTRRLVEQFQGAGFILPDQLKVNYALVAGKFKPRHEPAVRQIFEDRRWVLVGPTELVPCLRAFAERGYEDDLATIGVKLLQRNQPA